MQQDLTALSSTPLFNDLCWKKLLREGQFLPSAISNSPLSMETGKFYNL
jgi:hypothetical protein